MTKIAVGTVVHLAFIESSPMKSCLSISLLFVCLSLVASPESQAQVKYNLSDTGYVQGGWDTPKGNIFRRMSGRSLSGVSREQVFASNATKPLGGLFAPDFDLTANVFGGWNRIVGLGDIGDSFDDDFAVGIAYGRRHSERLRSEFEFTYRSNDANTFGSVDVYSIMKNFLVDIETPYEYVSPYVGIGIGYANIDSDFDSLSGISVDNAGAFAFQPIAGVSLEMLERKFLYFEYRYFSTTDLGVSVFDTAFEGVNYQAHNLFMGLRFEF